MLEINKSYWAPNGRRYRLMALFQNNEKLMVTVQDETTRYFSILDASMLRSKLTRTVHRQLFLAVENGRISVHKDRAPEGVDPMMTIQTTVTIQEEVDNA